jgi:hypothetical protein
MGDIQQPQQQPVPSEAKKPLSEDERKNLSHKRIYWAIVVLDILVLGLFFYEIVDLFLR